MWLEQELPAWFEERLLPVTKEVADRWGRLTAEVGRSVPALDGLLAATALHHGLRVVTRKARDFRLPGVERRTFERHFRDPARVGPPREGRLLTGTMVTPGRGGGNGPGGGVARAAERVRDRAAPACSELRARELE